MAVTSAVSDLFASISELISSFVGAIITIVQTIVMAFVNFGKGLFQLVADVFGGVFEMAGGLGKFVASNIVILIIGVIAAVAFVRYTAQGQRIANKKTQ